jgi:acyl-CoA thioester hydrolase
MRRFEYEITVPADAIDQLGHVNNIEYVRWVQDAAVRHSEAAGLDWGTYEEMKAAFVIRRHVIEYLREAHIGDVLHVATWIESATRITALRATEIRNAKGEPIVTAQTTWVFVSLETMRPVRINERVATAFGGWPDGRPTP